MARKFAPFLVVSILREIITVHFAHFLLNDHCILGVAVHSLTLVLRIPIFQSVDTIGQKLRIPVRSPHFHTVGSDLPFSQRVVALVHIITIVSKTVRVGIESRCARNRFL